MVNDCYVLKIVQPVLKMKIKMKNLYKTQKAPLQEGPNECLTPNRCKGYIITVGKRNYFTDYGILLHELPLVAVLLIQSNNNEEGTMKNSILHTVICKSLFRTSRPIVKLKF